MISAFLHYPGFFLTATVALGLLVGSFLNVVIYRLPIMLERDWSRQCRELLEIEDDHDQETFSLWLPRSRCTSCGASIPGYQNIPVLSYILLRGRCGACQAAISLRYPVIEILTALLFAMAAITYGPTTQFAAALILTALLVPLAFIDFDHQILPDGITIPGVWLGLLLNYFTVFTTLPAAFLGAVCGYLSLWLVFHGFKLLTGKEGMGYGDFKLLALLGAWLGWQYLPLIILLSALSGAVIGIAWLAINRKNRDTPIPFGPFLCIAGWIALIWGSLINDLYLRVSGLG